MLLNNSSQTSLDQATNKKKFIVRIGMCVFHTQIFPTCIPMSILSSTMWQYTSSFH